MPLLIVAAMGWAAPALGAPFLYVANHGDGDVAIIDTATNQVTGTVSVGNFPLGVAVDPEGAHVYVSNQDGTNGSVSTITTHPSGVTGVPVGDDPTGVALKLPGLRLYVANRVGKSVSVIDTATGDVLTTLPVGDNPLGVAVNPDGTDAYVVNKGSDDVTIIDTTTNQVRTTVAVGNNPTHVAVSPTGDRAYVTNNGGATVSVINTTTLQVTGTVSVDTFPKGVAFSPDGTRAYVTNSGPNTLSVIDTAHESVVATIPVGDGPDDVAVHPNGTRVYVFNRQENTISVIDTASNAEIDVDGDAGNGVTRIAVGVGPVALSQPLVPALRPPRFGRLALGCQAAIAANGRAFAKADQAQRSTCENLILKEVAAGNGTQQAEATCALALDLGNASSPLARARTAAHAGIAKRCTGVATKDLDRPCDRAASSMEKAIGCILQEHGNRVAEMVADTFTTDDSKPLTKAARACQATIASAASRLAQTEQAALAGCLLHVLKDAAKEKSIAVSAAACAKALDPSDPKATLTAARAAIGAKVAKKCTGLAPADIGNPCDPAATTITQALACVLAGQETRVGKMIAAEFNDACPMLTAVGLGRAYPQVCDGH